MMCMENLTVAECQIHIGGIIDAKIEHDIADNRVRNFSNFQFLLVDLSMYRFAVKMGVKMLW